MKERMIIFVAAIILGGILFQKMRIPSKKISNSKKVPTDEVLIKSNSGIGLGGVKLLPQEKLFDISKEKKCRNEKEKELCQKFTHYKGDPQFGVLIEGKRVYFEVPADKDMAFVLDTVLSMKASDLVGLKKEERKTLGEKITMTFFVWFIFNQFSSKKINLDHYEDHIFQFTIWGTHPLKGPGAMLISGVITAENLKRFIKKLRYENYFATLPDLSVKDKNYPTSYFQFY